MLKASEARDLVVIYENQVKAENDGKVEQLIIQIDNYIKERAKLGETSLLFKLPLGCPYYCTSSLIEILHKHGYKTDNRALDITIDWSEK